MDNRVIEGRKMYHLDEKQIQEITDYIFLEDKLEKADAIFIPAVPDQNIQRKRQGFIKMDMPRCYCHQEATRKYRGVFRVFQKKGRNTEQILLVRQIS